MLLISFLLFFRFDHTWTFYEENKNHTKHDREQFEMTIPWFLDATHYNIVQKSLRG